MDVAAETPVGHIGSTQASGPVEAFHTLVHRIEHRAQAASREKVGEEFATSICFLHIDLTRTDGISPCLVHA